MNLFGMVGFIGSGKSTACDIMVSEYGYEKFAFADTLKDAVSSVFGWPRHLLEGDTEESRVFRETKDTFWSNSFGYDVTPRLMLQKVGTEALRNNLHKNIWLSSLEKRIQGKPNVVISDVRFPNEIAFIRSLGGKIVRVKRGNDPVWYERVMEANEGNKSQKLMLDDLGIHESEYAWVQKQYDGVIENNGTIEDLKTQLKGIL